MKRVWEIDAVRGIAIIIMILYHAYYCLNVFFHIHFVDFSFFNLVGYVFIFVCGISSTFSRNNVKRGLVLLGWAGLITCVTYFLYPEQFVIFGILHLLGTSTLVYGLFLKKINNRFLLIIGSTFLVSAMGVEHLHWRYFLIFGIKNSQFQTLDYYPLIPYFGIYLLGVVFGRIVYRYQTSRLPFSSSMRPFVFLGRYSLLIYLIHLPIILLIIWFLIQL